MSIQNVITTTVTTAGAAPQQRGYGAALLLVNHSVFPDRIRRYTTPSAISSDGFSVNSVPYRMGVALLSSGQVSELYIGKRNNLTVQTVRITPTVTTLGTVNSINVRSPGFASEKTVSFTNGGAETVATICTGLTAAFNALLPGDGLGNTYLTVTNSVTHIDVLAITAGSVFTYGEPSASLTFEDRTSDPGIVADIAAVQATPGGDKWYMLAIDSNSKAEVVAASADIEAKQKVFLYQSMDSAIKSSAYSGGGTDVMNVLAVANRRRTAGLYSSRQNEFAGLALASQRLPLDPGTETWKYARGSVSSEVLSDTQFTNIVTGGKRGNVFVEFETVSCLHEGWTHSGAYIDEVRGLDWLVNQCDIAVYQTLLSLPKVPFTDRGIKLLGSAIEGVATRATATDNFPARLLDRWELISPALADISPANKAIRKLSKFTLRVWPAGAVHSVDLDINVL